MIEVKTINNFKNHLSQIFLLKNSDKVCGNYKDNCYEMWLSSQGILGLTGAFYPIISINTLAINSKVEIKIDAKMNPVGFLISAMIILIVEYGCISIWDIHDVPRSFIYNIILVGPFLIALLIIYFKVKRAFINELKENLALKSAA